MTDHERPDGAGNPHEIVDIDLETVNTEGGLLQMSADVLLNTVMLAGPTTITPVPDTVYAIGTGVTHLLEDAAQVGDMVYFISVTPATATVEGNFSNSLNMQFPGVGSGGTLSWSVAGWVLVGRGRDDLDPI